MKYRISLALLLLAGQCFGSVGPVDGSSVANIYTVLMKLRVKASNVTGDGISFGDGNDYSVMQIFRILREFPFFMVYRDPEAIQELTIVETGRKIFGSDRTQVQRLPRGEQVELSLKHIIEQLCSELVKRGLLHNLQDKFLEAFYREILEFMKIDPVSGVVMLDDQDGEKYYQNYVDSLSKSARLQYDRLKVYSVDLLNAVQQMYAVKQSQSFRPSYVDPSSTKIDFSKAKGSGDAGFSRADQSSVAALRVNIIDALRLAAAL